MPRTVRTVGDLRHGWLAIAAIALSPTIAEAQTPYSIVHSTETYSRFLTGVEYVPVAYGPLSQWDEGAVAVPLPFDFVWYGVPYRAVYVYTNGFLSFSPPPVGAGLLTPPSMVPRPEHPIHNYIGVLWGDLTSGANPSIRARVEGPLGSQTVAIQVEGLRASNNPNSEASFQVFLSEGSHQVDIIYGRNFGLSGLTAGIENANGTDGMNLMAMSSSCDASCFCAPRACLSPNFLPNKRIVIRPPEGVELNADIDVPTGAFPGASFDAQVLLRNVGLAAAGAFRYEVRLGDSPTSTTGSTLLQAGEILGLGGSTSLPVDLTLTVPPSSPVDVFYISVVVDSAREVAEAVESNNVAFSAPFATGPDLIGTLEGPAEAGPGEVVPFQLHLRSGGAPVVREVTVAFYLSTTPTRSPSS
ncbi:MAG: CARDB domain-containing protein, partial [Myxococcota bacterium]